MPTHIPIQHPELELLSPAGDYERLVMAVQYGADAVYLAGREFGMRSAAANFDNDTLIRGVEYAHRAGVRVYVTCNTLPREDELQRLPEYLAFLQSAGVDALIIADLGVLSLAQKYAPHVKKHVSTQLGVVNSATANFLYEQGADTVVLARELSLDEEGSSPGSVCARRYVRLLLRQVSAFQLSCRQRCQSRAMRPALPVEIPSCGGDPPGRVFRNFGR